MQENTPKIICPKCGCEYLPAEIYHAHDLLGRPQEIVRDKNRKIDFFTGTSMNLEEEFECIECETMFTVTAEITFASAYNKDTDFNEDYESVIYKNRMKLKEPK